MGVTVAVTRTTCNVGVGNQDLTTADLGGLVPQAALFIGCGATVDGTAHDDLSVCYGAATGSSERWVIATASDHGVVTTNTARRGATDECVMFIDGDGTVDGEADFVQFITNGCRINWGNAPSSAWYLTVVFFAGTDLTADAGVFTLGNQDVEVDVNTVGFEPDLLLLGSIARAINDAVGVHVHFSIGAAANKVGDPQYSYEYRSTDNVGTSAVQGRVTDDYAAMQIDSAAALDWGCEITNWDANGFSAFARGGNSGDDIGYLALAFNGVVDFAVGTFTSPVANGNHSVTDPGFTPQFAQVGMTQLTAFDTAYTGGEAGAYGISAFDDDDEYSNAYADEDAQGTSDTQSLSDNQAVNFPQDDGSAGYTATFVSFDALGWTLNFTAQMGAAHRW